MQEKGILDTVMNVPPSSPDINPIENVWSALKDFLQRCVKPKTKNELVTGIKQYWESLTDTQCSRYIDHIHKVLPHVVLNQGGPTNF